MNNRPLIGISTNYMKLGSHKQIHIRDRYISALYDYGAFPVLIPCFEDKELLRQYVSMVKSIIIIGGMDYPPELYGEDIHPKTEIMEMRRVKSDYYLLDLAMEHNKPVLGICAGMQLINIYFGGKLIQHLDNLDIHYGEKEHLVTQSAGRWLSQIEHRESFIVNSNHHQGIDTGFIGKNLVPVANSEDGGIEALEYTGDQCILGIQWHPERMRDLHHRKAMFEFFINQG